MGLTQVHMIFRRGGSYFIRHRRTLFDIYGATPATNDQMSSLVCLKAWTALLSCFFAWVLPRHRPLPWILWCYQKKGWDRSERILY